MRAFAYLRVSGMGQVDGDGFERQLSAIRAYAKANGVTVVKVWREEGVSGKIEGVDRPEWAAMVAEIMAGEDCMILVERLDRLARDLMVQEHIIADLRKRRITLVSVAEPDLCLDDPSRKLLRQIMGAIAEYDRAMIVAKTRAARERIRKSGKRCEGAKPYGQQAGEPEIVTRMRTWRARGDSLEKICARLQEDGVAARRGGAWLPMTVQRILRRAA